MKLTHHSRGRRRLPDGLTKRERQQTGAALKGVNPAEFHRDDRHEQSMAMLAAEEAALKRAIMLRKEYQEMNQTEVIPAPQANLISVIMTSARDPGTNAEKMRQLLEMAERMMKFEAERQFNDAMRLCQEEIGPIAKTTENTHTGTMYAKLESIDREIKPVYTSHGFVMTFGSAPARAPNCVRVTCDVRHSAGHTVQYELEGGLDTAGLKGTSNKTAIRGLGSTVTNLRRYLTMMIWNLSLQERMPAITREQAETVWSLIDSAGITGPRRRDFLKFAQAESVETIGSFRYNDVMMMLQRAEANKRLNGASSG